MPHVEPKATTASAPNGLTNGHTNGHTNGIPPAPVDGALPTAHGFDPHFTQAVIDAMGPNTSPRVRQVMTSLIRHVHDFARENLITVDEWMAGLEMVGGCFSFCSPSPIIPYRST